MKSISNALTRMFSLMGKKVTPEIILEWSSYLLKQGLTKELIGAACGQAVQDPEVDPFRFTIAKLMAYVKPTELDPKALALEEWDTVVSYVSRGKATLGIPQEWEQRTVSAVGSIGGLNAIGDADNEKLGYLRHAFINAYAEYAGIYKNREKQMMLEGNSNPLLEGTLNELSERTRI